MVGSVFDIAKNVNDSIHCDSWQCVLNLRNYIYMLCIKRELLDAFICIFLSLTQLTPHKALSVVYRQGYIKYTIIFVDVHLKNCSLSSMRST